METVLNLLLIRFAVIAAVVVVVALILFAIAVGLRRRGRWEQTRDRVVDSALPIIKGLTDTRSDPNLQGGSADGRRSVVGSVGRAAMRYAADRAATARRDQQQMADESSDTDRVDRR
ncbi:hypothetical protein SAMN04489812_3332 [Microlunatus soli]|uniref:Uncharacterized protein n=2 Tax=Microlunatus soli TaxID=630515 RepID=A0A1H1VS19_9ACTN|nr:hypothetical protein SAMN04489812_3332 [Microlunatus soli]